MRLTGPIGAGVALLLLAGGCVEPRYGETPFACARTQRCPDGYRCVDGLCQRGVTPAADATPTDGGPDRGDQRPAGDGRADGGDPRLAPFAAPQPIAELNSPSGDDNPSLTDDLLEIFFDSRRNAGGRRRPDTDLWTARRAAASAPWEKPTSLTELNSAQDEVTPEVSADGLTLFFASARQGGGSTDVYVTTRSSRTSAWGAPTLVTALGSTRDDRSPTPAPDLLTMVLASDRPGGAGAMDLFATARATVTATWNAPAAIVELSTADAEESPWADAAGTLIYFASDRPGGGGGLDLWRAVRAARGAPYGPATPVAELNSAGQDSACWLSADGSLIVFASSRDGNLDLYSARR